MIIGTKWLRKLLGAFAKLNNPNCIDAIEQEWEAREGIIAEMTDPMEIVNQYLISSMFALGLFTGVTAFDDPNVREEALSRIRQKQKRDWSSP